MRKYIVLVGMVLLFVLPATAQQKTPPATGKTDPPVLSDKQLADIALLERDLVLDQAQIQQLQQQYSSVSEKMRADNANLQKKLDDAKIPGWDLDRTTLKYTKAPEPAKPAGNPPSPKSPQKQ